MFSSNCNYYRDIALQEEVDGKVVVVAHLKFTYTPLLINRLNCLPIQVSIIVKDSILSVYGMDARSGDSRAVIVKRLCALISHSARVFFTS